MHKPISINRLIYRSYLGSSLIPIFTIEVVLLLLYFGINLYIAEKNEQLLLREATANIHEIVSREAEHINARLQEVSRTSLLMQRDHQQFFGGSGHCVLPNGTPEFSVHANGAYYKTKDNGGSSVYYSATTLIGETERNKALCTEMLDPLMVSIVEVSPIITQAYLNTWDDMNRLFPFIADSPQQYGPAIDMEDFNFYYEADAAHNPAREPVWTGAYLDPAGQGWMISLVVPVYRGDFLEGVSGLDVTIDSFVQNILGLEMPWDASVLMVDQHGTILAMQQHAEQLLGIRELKTHVYQGNIQETVEKPEEFNVLSSANASVSRQFRTFWESSDRVGRVSIADVDYLLSQEVVAQTGWRMLTLIEEARVLAPVTGLKELTNRIGYVAIAAMIFFYVVFFLYLLRRSGRLTLRIAAPIARLSQLTHGLGENLRSQKLTPVGIEEIDGLGENFNKMALELEAKTGALIEAKLLAEGASRDKSCFLANVSHELRTPMNSILGMADLALQTSLDDTQRRYIEKSRQAALRLLALINDILDFSQADTRQLQLDLQPFDLTGLLQALERQLGPKAAARGVSLTIGEAPDLPCVLVGDAQRLRQLLLHLGDNAVKFSNRGGAVSLGVEADLRSGAEVALHFRVQDDGIGIAPEQQGQLFRSFSQLDGSSTREHGGLGLGLVICKRLAELMDGEIRLESAPGSGSLFHFIVQLRCQADALPPAGAVPVGERALDTAPAVGEAVGDDVIDRVAVGEALAQLRVALDDYSVEAIDSLQLLRPQLAHTAHAGRLDRLAGLIEAYDFEGAMAQLLELRDALGIDPGHPTSA